MAGDVRSSIDWRDLNRTVLARQSLLERSSLPLHRVVERMAGIQAQYAPSAYVGLWSRTAGFTKDALTAALHRRSIVQGTLMRGTIHMVSQADYWPMAAAIRERNRDWWLQVQRLGVDGEDMARLAATARALLADGPRRRNDLVADLGIESGLWSGLGFWVDLVRVPPSGTWERRRADLFGLAEWWVGMNNSGPGAGTDLLIRRYLAGFGPASREDIKAFTSLGLSVIDDSLRRLRARALESENGVLYDLRQATLLDGDVPAPVRFLGTWDAILLVHARRALVLPEEYRSRIFHTKAPHSFNTFLVDGQVAGTWREEGETVVLEPFHPIPRRFQRELDDEREALEVFLRS